MRQMMNKCCMEQITEQRDEEKTQLFVWVLLNNRRKPRTGPGGGRTSRLRVGKAGTAMDAGGDNEAATLTPCLRRR